MTFIEKTAQFGNSALQFQNVEKKSQKLNWRKLHLISGKKNTTKTIIKVMIKEVLILD